MSAAAHSHKLPTAIPKRHRSSLSYPAMAKAQESRRTWGSVVVTGVSFKERRTITAASYGLLDVDPAYQRGRTDMVNQIIGALQRGGTVPDVPAVAQRDYGPQDGKLWIMDGFQRISALIELDRAFEVDVWVTTSIEAERQFFLALNNRRSLNANTQVKAWSGPITELLVYLNTREGPLQGRLSFGVSTGERLPAAILARGIERLLGGSRGTNSIQKILSHCDAMLKTDAAKRKATGLCHLIGQVWPKGHALQTPIFALAEVAAETWKGEPRELKFPTNGQLTKLQAINWRSALPSQGMIYTDLAVQIVRRAWK